MSQTERRDRSPAARALSSRPALVASGSALAVTIGLLGQWALDHWPASPSGWVLLLGSAAAFALLAGREAIEQPRRQGQAALRPRLALLGAGLLLAALAFPGFTGNRFWPLPTLAWLAALALGYLAFRLAEPPAGRSTLPPLSLLGRDGLHLSWHALVLVGILVVAAVLRLYQLDTIPREMGTDMPHNYENARQILQGQFMIFCPSYPGRESLFFYLVAACSGVFGLSFLSIKLASALVGLATVLALYGVARDLFDREVALIAAALLAVSKWHVILSRTGYRASLMPLAVLAVIELLVRALRSGRASDWLLAGAAIGLGMYTYNAFMIVPLAVAAALAVELVLQGGGALRRNAWGLGALAVGALLVFLPLGRYALEQPESYFFRVATRVTGIEAPLPKDLLATFAGNLVSAAGMFNLHGDEVALSNVPEQRHLGLVSGVLFVFGLAYALRRWRRGHNASILVFLASLILPTALAVAFPREVPNAVRASGVIVPACLLAALPLAHLRRHLAAVAHGKLDLPQVGSGRTGPARSAMPGFRPWAFLPPSMLGPAIGAMVLVGLLGGELLETWHTCFVDYVAHLPGRNYAISLEIAQVLDDFAPEGRAFVKIWPYWFDGNALRAQLKVMSKSWDWEVPELDPAKPPLSTARGKLLFIVHPDDQATLRMLAAEFPRGVAINHRSDDGRVAFVTFYGER